MPVLPAAPNRHRVAMAASALGLWTLLVLAGCTRGPSEAEREIWPGGTPPTAVSPEADRLYALALHLSEVRLSEYRWTNEAQTQARHAAQTERVRQMLREEEHLTTMPEATVAAAAAESGGNVTFERLSLVKRQLQGRAEEVSESMPCSGVLCGLCDGTTRGDLWRGIDLGDARTERSGMGSISVGGVTVPAAAFDIYATITVQTSCSIDHGTFEDVPGHFELLLANDPDQKALRAMLDGLVELWDAKRLDSDDKGYLARTETVAMDGSGGCIVSLMPHDCHEGTKTTLWFDGRVMQVSYAGQDTLLWDTPGWGGGCSFFSDVAKLHWGGRDHHPGGFGQAEIPPRALLALMAR